MKILRLISRIILGLVFIFSGIVKAIDPLGTAYKFHDYFQAFNIGFLNSLSLTLAILLCTAEFIAGFSVITGMKLKPGLWGTFLLLVIFTPVTFILALTNPVSDCGCFGDAVHLTNWQTFGKNVILLAFWGIAFSGRNKTQKLTGNKTEWSVLSGATVLFVIFCFLNLRYLPVIDFLPYKKDVRIADKMNIPEGAPADQYKTTFIYEKEGIRKEFSLEDYPANDSTWKFVDQKSVLIKKGYVPPIHDFQVTSVNGENLTEKILSDNRYSLLMITKKLTEARQKNLSEGFELGRYCRDNGINFYILTSSGSDELKSYRYDLVFCTADETTLKTMMRANPGYILIKDGIIIDKWSWANVPDEEWFGALSATKEYVSKD
jgi:uncharacterized membrane protein YphA (DoxX/SURF4 family)